MADYPNLTIPAWDSIYDLADRDLVDETQLENALRSAGAGFAQAYMTALTREVESGVLTVDRQGQTTWIKVDAVGATATIDTITENGPAFHDGDILVLSSISDAKTVTVEDGTAAEIGTGNFSINAPHEFIALRRGGGVWGFAYSNPAKLGSSVEFDQMSLSDGTNVISSGSVAVTKALQGVVSEKTAETVADGSVEITGAGGSGGITVKVDEGSGPFVLSQTAYTTTTTAAAHAQMIVDQINDGVYVVGYTATRSGDIAEIFAPAGTGSAGNLYQLTVDGLKGSTTATVTGFSGGVDGTYQDVDLTDVAGLSVNQVFFIKNEMSGYEVTLKNTGNLDVFDDLVLKHGFFAQFLFDGTNAQLIGGKYLLETSLSPIGDGEWQEGITGKFYRSSVGTLHYHKHEGTAAAQSGSLVYEIQLPSNYNQLVENGLRVIAASTGTASATITVTNYNTATADPSINGTSLTLGAYPIPAVNDLNPTGTYTAGQKIRIQIDSSVNNTDTLYVFVDFLKIMRYGN